MAKVEELTVAKKSGLCNQSKIGILMIFLCLAGIVWYLRHSDGCPPSNQLRSSINTKPGGSVTKRMESAYLIGKYCGKDTEMVSVLRKVLEDRKDDKHVRSSAAIALGRIGGGKSANSSLELLKSIRDSKDSADLKILKDACEWAITRLREAQSNK